MRAEFVADYRPQGDLETTIVDSDDDPSGVFVAGQFVAFVKTVDGWAFIAALDALELVRLDEWQEAEFIGVPCKARLLAGDAP